MNAKFNLDDSKNMYATMELTMTIGEWKELSAQLQDNVWPSWKLRAAISNSISKLFAQVDAIIEEK